MVDGERGWSGGGKGKRKEGRKEGREGPSLECHMYVVSIAIASYLLYHPSVASRSSLP